MTDVPAAEVLPRSHSVTLRFAMPAALAGLTGIAWQAGLPGSVIAAVPAGLLLLICTPLDWPRRSASFKLMLLLAVGAVLAIALFGILLEAGFMGAGLVNFAGHPVLGVLPPVWVWALWLGFASLPNGSLGWLQGRPVLQAGLGLVFGPLAYWTGAKMGAASMPTAGAFLVIALAWALAFPVIMAMAARLSPRQAA